MASAPDWIEALSTLAAAAIAGCATWVGLKTFRSQRTVSDVELSVTIFNEISRYWDRIIDHCGAYEYNMGQVLAQFEIAASLFNRGVLTKDAACILGDHIVEVFSQLISSSAGENLVASYRSSETTFLELRKFIRLRMPQALNAIEFGNRKQGAEWEAD